MLLRKQVGQNTEKEIMVFINGSISILRRSVRPPCCFTLIPSAVTDDWFVSPPFNFSNGGKLDSISFWFGGFGIPALSDTVAIYLVQGSSDPALATSTTTLLDFRAGNYQNDNT